MFGLDLNLELSRSLIRKRHEAPVCAYVLVAIEKKRYRESM
jgi:hypothetical protein